MRIRQTFALLAAATVCAMLAAPTALASDLTDVGFVDQAAIGALPQFAQANAQLARYKAQLDAQFSSAIKNAKTDAQRQRIAGPFQAKFAAQQRQVLGPLFARAQTAIAQVSSTRGLSVIVDKRIVIYGGQNVTNAVLDLLRSPGAIAPPVSTPPPSEIGFVDQPQIDTVPKIKNANDEFLRFADQQKAQLGAAMTAAKNDRQKQQQLLKDTQKTIADKQEQLLKPLVDLTRNAMADVAKKKSLILVVDRADVIYGGMDITQDVQNEVK
ncbi:MAG: hypothetical protein M3Z07_00440 [Candidatus Eremiobacteraeota bacterium]|nr:hypothetical protein [Candidatus Eremiobacteraeota bacterium]